METQHIYIRMEGLESSEHFSPPQDPLDELAPYQMQFSRFCYEQNRTVRIGLGAQVQQLVMDDSEKQRLRQARQTLEANGQSDLRAPARARAKSLPADHPLRVALGL